MAQGLEDVSGLLELAVEADDEETFNEAVAELDVLEEKLAQLEFRRMFSGEYDSADCYLDIQAGSGGTEAQDWASMLMRMYLRWAEARGFKTEIIEESEGEVAGIKSVTIKIIGDYAYGWLRTETGVHRPVRKSPFDSGGRRHTSFSSAFVYPEVDEDIDIDINPADLRIDVYRASGAGGQHVNRTESAVRITHIPTGLVTQCQNDRSQHKNKDRAMKQMKAKLYELEMQKKMLRSRRWKTTSPISAGAARSVLTSLMTPASKTCAPGLKPVTRRRCWTAARPIYRSKFESRVMRNQHV